MDVDGSQSITKPVEIQVSRPKKIAGVFGRAKVSIEAELLAFLTRPPENHDPQEEVDWKCFCIFERSFNKTGEDG